MNARTQVPEGRGDYRGPSQPNTQKKYSTLGRLSLPSGICSRTRYLPRPPVPTSTKNKYAEIRKPS